MVLFFGLVFFPLAFPQEIFLRMLNRVITQFIAILIATHHKQYMYTA